MPVNADFRAIVEGSAALITLLAPDGRIIYQNPAVTEVLHCGPAALSGRCALRRIHRDDRRKAIRTFAGVLERGESATVRLRVRTREGEWRTIQSTLANRLGDPAVAAVVATSHNVSTQAEIERALEEQRVFLRVVLDANPTLIFAKDGAGRYTLANTAVARAYGTTPAELIGRTDDDFNPDPEQVSGYRACDRAVLETGEPLFVLEEPLTDRGTGEVRWLQTRKVRFVPPDGGPAQVLGVAADVTELRQAQERQRQTELQFRAVFESAAAGIALVDAGGKVWAANAALQAMLGYSEEELRERSLADLTVDGGADLQRLRELIRRPRPSFHEERECRHRDGSTIWVHFTIAAVRDEQGSPAYAVAILDDVTEHRHALAALHEREEQLRLSRRIEALGRLAGGVAHDFNNNLMVIMAHAHVLRRDPLVAERRASNVEALLTAAGQAADLTHQLLAFSRQQVLQPRVVDPNESVREAMRLLGRVVGEHVRLEADLAGDAGHVEVDPSQLQQVLVNLIVNARDAIPGGGRITLTTTAEELPDGAYALAPLPAGRYVVISVQDDGEGMDDATLARIFEPFFTTKSARGGSGLGLATAYGIVKQSGGFVVASSQPGAGSRFDVLLPQTERTPEAPAAAPPRPSPAAAGETVLLVEDEAEVLSVLRMALEEQGYRVLAAPDAPGGLRLAEAHAGRLDLVVTDVVMPGMSGPQMVERLAVRRPGLRVLYLSGYPGDATALTHPGVEVSFLHKPAMPVAVLERVRDLVKGVR